MINWDSVVRGGNESLAMSRDESPRNNVMTRFSEE